MGKVEFWGAAQTVTGSMHLVHWRGRRLLLDCGLFQGRRKEAFQRNRDFPLYAKSIDAVILSHAHIDHSGNLPSLIKAGYTGPIYATDATRDLATYLLIDAAKIQESDVAYVNKKRRRNKQTPFEPLYEHDDAIQTIRQLHAMRYEETFEPIPHVSCRFFEAGHMLGAAMAELTLTAENGESTRLLFSGDIGRSDMPILKNPRDDIENVDYVIMEGTYGDRDHAEVEKGGAKKILHDLVHDTYRRRGKLIIPAFSVGRTQEIVYRLNLLKEDGQLPDIPVFVDSPLAVNATEVFRDKDHVECFDEEMIQQIIREEDQDPLAFENLHYIRKAEYSRELNTYDGPCVIISASGMCEAGRILHHLKNHAVKDTTTILFTGYQAPHTLGRRILEGDKEVRIYGDKVEIRAQVAKLESSSGHADRAQLLEWVRSIASRGQLKTIALVHCELDSGTAFKNLLEQQGLGQAFLPARGESMELV